jgi:hypothetical protein
MAALFAEAASDEAIPAYVIGGNQNCCCDGFNPFRIGRKWRIVRNVVQDDTRGHRALDVELGLVQVLGIGTI